MRYRFTLEKYKGTRTRHTCPNCGKPKEFIRYVDTETGKHLADHVGRCNREVNCGYHYTPKRYFKDNEFTAHGNDALRQPQKQRPPVRTPESVSTIPFKILSESLTDYSANNFVRYLHSAFNERIAAELIKRFYIGTSNYWEAATVFWQIDIKGRVRSGKIMLYDAATGRRVKEIQSDGSKRSKITWAHSVLLKNGMVQSFNLRQCLFGEHQLSLRPKNIPVAIVESEKTAIIASVFLPDLIWLGCGSLTNLTLGKCNVLAGRNVVLFPDLKCFEKWSSKAKQLERLLDCKITVSRLLEGKACETDKARGFDLADYLMMHDPAAVSLECDGSNEELLLAEYLERASIIQYEAGLSRRDAESIAWRQMFGEPDDSLPNEIHIPANVSNSVEAIILCVDSQQLTHVA